MGENQMYEVELLLGQANESVGLLPILGISLCAFLLVCGGLAIGLFFGRRPISGSCGGIANMTNENGETSCSLCQNPGEACKELRRQMETANEASD